MKNTFKVNCVAIHEADNRHQIVLLMPHASGDCWSYLPIDKADLDKPNEISDLLKNRGVDVPKGRKQAERFVEDKVRRPMGGVRERLITDATGWHTSGTFVTADRTYGSAKMLPMHSSRLCVIKKRAGSISGSLKYWKRSLGALAERSHTAIFAIGHALSGPLLGKALPAADSPIFNVWSDTSSGKSTLLTIANTCFLSQNSVPTLPTFNQTARAREEALASRNGLFMPFDEENLSDAAKSRLQSSGIATSLSNFIFDVASGQGRSRSQSVKGTLPNKEWVCAILTSSNRPAVSEGNSDSPTGVRIIDLRVRCQTRGGIFECNSEELAAPQRSDIIKRAVAGCVKHRGAVGKAWLTALTDKRGQGKIFKRVKELHAEFIEMHGSTLKSSQLRVLEKFANVYATVVITAEMKLVPWSVDRGKFSVGWCYRRYVTQRKDAYLDVVKTYKLLMKLVGQRAIFPDHSEVTDDRQTSSLGFLTEFKKRRVACVRDRNLKKLGNKIGCGGEGLWKLLASSNVLVRDASGKNTILVRDPATKERKRFVTLDLEKLKKVVS